MKKTLKAPEVVIDEGVIFTAKSFFADRFIAKSEKVIADSYKLPAGFISHDCKPQKKLKAPSNLTKKERLKALFNNKTHYFSEDQILIEVRHNTPANWAHTLNFHIPFLLYLQDYLKGVSVQKQIVFVLNRNTPNYIISIFNLLNLRIFLSNEKIEGHWVEYKQIPFDCVRSFAHDWVKKFLHKHSSFKRLCQTKEPCPSRVFISRKDTRKILNENEVQSFLEGLDFKKVYAEDLEPAEQIRLFLQADIVVAVHGAAIAPLLYRPGDIPPLKIVEIFNPGHMTNYYRGVAQQVSATWVGVRGQIDSKMIKKAYCLETPFIKYSLADFTVDIVSLRRALEYINVKP